MNSIRHVVLGLALAVIGAAPWAAATAQVASLQDLAKAADAAGARPGLVIYTAREIVTLDPARPSAQAVSVRGDRPRPVGQFELFSQGIRPQIFHSMRDGLEHPQL